MTKLVDDETWPEELRDLRFHDLRHTAASLMISLNANPKAIQGWLGHSSIQVTFDRYGHLLPGFDQAITEGLDALRTTAMEQRKETAEPAPVVPLPSLGGVPRVLGGP